MSVVVTHLTESQQGETKSVVLSYRLQGCSLSIHGFGIYIFIQRKNRRGDIENENHSKQRTKENHDTAQLPIDDGRVHMSMCQAVL